MSKPSVAKMILVMLDLALEIEQELAPCRCSQAASSHSFSCERHIYQQCCYTLSTLSFASPEAIEDVVRRIRDRVGRL